MRQSSRWPLEWDGNRAGGESCPTSASRVAGESLLTRHLGDALHAPRSFEDFLKMRAILDLDSKRPCHVAICRRKLERPDVGVSSRDCGCEIRIQSTAIGRIQYESNDEALTLELLPVDVEPPLRLEIEHQKVRT